ncbi:MAG: CBS domain-containing protein [Candidatus Verstraetearchaeota archaeon]|nr:CBS domain-containing protein [Candidatus Verstraetearchaeota archaeon]
MLVGSVMTKDVIFAEVPGKRSELLELMRKHKVTGLPVVKRGTREVAGIVTRQDLLEHVEEEQTALLMTRDVVNVTPETPLNKAASIMLERGFRRLPVVDDKGQLVGIITIGDIIHRVFLRKQAQLSSLTIDDIPLAKPYLVWESTPLTVLSYIMKVSKAEVSAVLNSDFSFVGVLSLSDIVFLSELEQEETQSSLSAGSEGQEWDWDSSTVIYITKRVLTLPSKPVHEVMSKPPVTIAEHAGVAECVRKMKRFDVDQIFVVSASGEIIGVLRDIDLVRTVITKLEKIFES